MKKENLKFENEYDDVDSYGNSKDEVTDSKNTGTNYIKLVDDDTYIDFGEITLNEKSSKSNDAFEHSEPNATTSKDINNLQSINEQDSEQNADMSAYELKTASQGLNFHTEYELKFEKIFTQSNYQKPLEPREPSALKENSVTCTSF